MNTKPLSGKVALVTGASQGIGKAIALALADAGAMLCIVGREYKKLEAVREQAHTPKDQVFTYQADLTVDLDVQNFSSYINNEIKRLDILVLCAGLHSMGLATQVSPDSFDTMYRANVRAPYVLIQALLPLLQTAHGQIVFVNSTVGLQARAQVGQFAATQHALKAMADSLRDEINVHGVRVLSIFPGRTATPRQAEIYRLEDKAYHPELLLQPEDIATMVTCSLCLPRTAEVTEIRMRPLLKSY